MQFFYTVPVRQDIASTNMSMHHITSDVLMHHTCSDTSHEAIFLSHVAASCYGYCAALSMTLYKKPFSCHLYCITRHVDDVIAVSNEVKRGFYFKKPVKDEDPYSQNLCNF